MSKKPSKGRARAANAAARILLDRPPEEYKTMLAEQLELIRSDCRNFDLGQAFFAPQIATKLRVLLYDRPNPKSQTPSVSLLTQLGMTGQSFFNTEYWFTEGDPMLAVGPHRGMAFPLRVNDNGKMLTRWQANLFVQTRAAAPPPTKPFPAWWEMLVIVAGKGFSRRSLITAVSNHDSGAHVAPKIEERYFNLTRRDETSYFQSFTPENGQTIHASNEGSGLDLARAVVRQIAHEVLMTLLPDPEQYESEIPPALKPIDFHLWVIFHLTAPLEP